LDFEIRFSSGKTFRQCGEGRGDRKDAGIPPCYLGGYAVFGLSKSEESRPAWWFGLSHWRNWLPPFMFQKTAGSKPETKLVGDRKISGRKDFRDGEK
jgi:hypothetical protein